MAALWKPPYASMVCLVALFLAVFIIGAPSSLAASVLLAPIPTVSIGNASVTEGNTGTVGMVFTVSLSAPSDTTVSVNYATEDGSATAGADYVASTNTLTFSPGQVSQNISIAVNGDLIDEYNAGNFETFAIRLSSPTNATLGTSLGTGTIIDDDPPRVSISNVSVPEGNAGTVSAQLTVSLTAASDQVVTVDYASAPGTAAAGSDYQSPCSGTVTFPIGTITQKITCVVNGDVTDEFDETFLVNLTQPVNTIILDSQGQVTIQDDDSPPAASIDNCTVTEGDAGTTNCTFTVTLSAPSEKPISIDYATANGSATSVADYAAKSGTLNFAPGVTSQTITVAVNGDTIDEIDEDFVINLSNPGNVAIQDSQGTGTIQDDDAAPTISIGDATVIEGNVGSVNAVFTISLTGPSGKTITVNYCTADDTAIAPADYTSACGAGAIVTFAPGQTSRNVTIPVAGDTTDEIDESFFVNLATPTNATIADGQGQGTILDDDAAPTISIGDCTVPEGNAGTTDCVFTVTLSAASEKPISVDYATANGTATAGADYVAKSGTLNFAPGVTSQTVTIVVNGDTTDEEDETFFVNLSNPSSVTPLDGQGQGMIVDDDDPPTVSIGDCTVPEGDAGTTDCSFNVTLSAASQKPITVDYAAANGTATVGADYVAKSGTLTLAPGVTTQTITVAVNGDTTDEEDENFLVNLSNPSNVTPLDGQGQGNILDDDAPPTVSIGDCTVTEGNTGTTNCSFTVTLSAASAKTVLINYATADGTASAPADYSALATAGLTFAPGVTSQTILVPINGDTTDENDETFFVNLTSPTNVTIADGQGTGTILDDDAAPTLSIGDAVVTEGTSGTVSAVFSVSLSAASGKTVTVNYGTANNTASAGSDYIAASGSLTFSPGVVTQNISVIVNGDAVPEATETFFVNLTNPANATTGDNQGLGTILDGGTPTLTLSIGDASVTEGDSGTVNAVFTVSLSASSLQPVTVDYTTASDTATAPADFLSKSGAVTFAPGQTTQNITIQVKGDTTDEIDETFLVNLSNPANAIIALGQGIGTIADDDLPPSLAVGDCTATEGNGGSTSCVFTASLSAASAKTVTVNYATANDTAIAPGDYTARSGSLIFPAGTTSVTVSILINGDTLDEFDETFFLNLSGAVNGTIVSGQGLGTIIDNDPLPIIAIGDCSVTEGNSGTVACTLTATLSAPSGKPVTVAYTSADDTAASGSDYVAQSGTLTFPAGTTTQPITLVINGDTLDEPDETFAVNLSNPGNATIGDGQGVGTINDDDLAPSISIGDANVVEGNAGSVNAVFSVSLSATSGKTITVTYLTTNNTATEPGDYVKIVPTTLTFPPGTTTKNITVQVNGDTTGESNETFFVSLVNPGNVSIGDGQGVGTIIDDDLSPATISISDISVTEGHSGFVNATFTVSLSSPSNATVTVAYATANGTATEPSDYIARSGTVTFTPNGPTTQTITISVKGDALVEPDETFFVNLSGAINAAILDGQGVGTIRNDDTVVFLPLVKA